MLATLARRVCHFAGIAGDLGFRPVSERLARYLAGRVPTPIEREAFIELDLTQAALAARLGTVRNFVARALAQLEASGVIVRRRLRTGIRDPTRLAALALGDEAPRPRPTGASVGAG